MNYELINIIANLGETSTIKHFVVYCKSFVDQNWYLFNDKTVIKINNLQDLYNGTPYILFYKVMGNN